MANQYYLSCICCDNELKLTNDGVDSIDNNATLSCECGCLLQPDDVNYIEARDVIKKRQQVKIISSVVAVLCAVMALIYNAPGVLPGIGAFMTLLISSINSGEALKIKTKLVRQ